jgi:hypothetical protein
VCTLDEHAQQLRADAPAAGIGAHVERVLDGEAIARPGAKIAEGAECGDAVRIARDEHRIALGGACLPPAPPLSQRDRGAREDGRRARNHFVVDRHEAFEVGLARILHREGAALASQGGRSPATGRSIT